ncbi:hypothetical protein [Streptomyces lavendulae]|uniref:hypothetical protein n=1 Tax=Streptomyces lavendulae TaxID=1914 RepID=UPI003829DA60
MTSKPKHPVRPKESAVTPDQVVELYGPEDDGWYATRVLDWVALCEQLKDGEVRGYLILRSLVIDKFKNHVRVLTLQLLCELIPSPSGGPSSMTRIRGILDGLTKVGLVTTPEGTPIKTSSRASAAGKPLRIRINDAAPANYQGWRNSEDKLKALGTALADLLDKEAERPIEAPGGAVQQASGAGRISDPLDEAGRISDPAGRKSDPEGRISDPDLAGDLRERDLPFGSSVGSSLSVTADSTVPLVTAEVETDKTERENPATPDKPTPVSAAAAVADVFAELWKTKHGTRPGRRTIEAVAVDAAEAIEDGDAVEWLVNSVVPFMVGRRYIDLGSAKTHRECPSPLGTKLPGQRVVDMPPYCGDLDCDELTRMRSKEDEQGWAVVEMCECHPVRARQMAAAS